jgi:hypothetical protein
MLLRLATAALLAVLTALVACSAGGGNGAATDGTARGRTADGGVLAACEGTPGGSCVDAFGCAETLGTAADVSAMKQDCASKGATWADGPCDRTAMAGGCCVPYGGATAAQTYWVPTGGGVTGSMQQASCLNGGGEWITP